MDKEFKLEPADHGGILPNMGTVMHGNVPPVSWDDKEIFIRKAFEEDPQKGCELLFKQYYQPLCSHVVRFIYSKEIAEDLVSDIFYALLEKRLYLHIHSSYRMYLFTAARNRALKHIRKEFGKAGEVADSESSPYASAVPSPQQILLFDELSRKIDRTIQSLAPRSQKVFLMNRFEGKKYQEIANELNVSVKAVEAHISKALSTLRNAVRNEVTVVFLLLLIEDLV